jgi:hypothetical protein
MIRERHVDPHRDAVGVDERAVLRIRERSAAGGDDEVAHRLQELQDLAFDGAEVRLAALREDVGDRPALARFDQIVDVLGPPSQARASARAIVLLPLAMNPTR